MAKVPATVRPFMVAESADGVIEGGDSSELDKYIQLCTECERIAIQIHPSYKEQYNDVSAMMRIPPAIANSPIAALYLFMTGKKETHQPIHQRVSSAHMLHGFVLGSFPPVVRRCVSGKPHGAAVCGHRY